MANEHGKLLSWKFFSRFSITTPATRWELAATVANRNWFNSKLAQRACGWQCPLNGEGEGRRLCLPPTHHLRTASPRLTLSHDSSWNRYLGPFVRGSCWVSAAALSGWKADDACICLWSFGIVWLVDWLQLTIINILSIIWCLICASHFVSSPSSPFFRLLLQLLFFLCLASSLLTSSARAMTFCFDCEVRFRFVWFVLVVLELSTDLVYVIRRACSAGCSNKGRRKTSKKYIANIKSKLRAQMQTSFAQTKSELAPKLEPEYECE